MPEKHFFKSKYPDIEPLSNEHQQLSYLYLDSLNMHADRVLLVDNASGRQWTGAQIKSAALAIGTALVEEYGLKVGDVCGILYRHSDWAIICNIATLFAGGITAFHCHDDPYPEYRHSYQCVLPKFIFTTSLLHNNMLQLQKDISTDFKIIWLDNDAKLNVNDLPHDTRPVAHLDDLRAYSIGPELSDKLPIDCDPEMPASILYTSGSTGLPKAVIRTRKMEAHVCVSLYNTSDSLWNIGTGSVQAGHVTLAHGTGTFAVHQAIVNGAKLIILGHYNIDEMLSSIEKYKITTMMLGAAHLHNLMMDTTRVAKYDISSLVDVIAIGGRITSNEVAARFMDRHSQCAVRQAYGMTEAAFLSIVPRDKCRSALASAGELLPSVKVRLIDRDQSTEITDYNKSGELYIYSPFVAPGYYGNAAHKSREAFMSDGAYKSDDMAYMSPDNQLHLQGRFSEVLCLDDGWKITPESIEMEIMQHEWVAEVAVVGLASKSLPGCHAPRAYVVLKQGHPSDITEQDIIDFVAKRVSQPKQLYGGAKILKGFPRTIIGKINRKLLRQSSEYTDEHETNNAVKC